MHGADNHTNINASSFQYRALLDTARALRLSRRARLLPKGHACGPLDLAPVSPAAGRGFLLAQRLRQASTKLGAVSSLVLWRRVGRSLIKFTHLRSVVGLELLRSQQTIFVQFLYMPRPGPETVFQEVPLPCLR